MSAVPPSPFSSEPEKVFMLHGLAANRWVLKPLELRLRQRGFHTINWGYDSVRGEIRSLADDLRRELLRLETEADHYHIVAHSMGGIILRAALASANLPKLRRIVLLGPPNHGSSVAANLSRPLGWFCQPLVQLSNEPGSFVNQVPEPSGYEIGIISALHDRLVAADSTTLSRATDRVVVSSGHTGMLFRRDVADLVTNFLQGGVFSRGDRRSSFDQGMEK